MRDRRKRGTTEEERRLFHESLAHVRPLKRKPIVPPKEKLAPRPPRAAAPVERTGVPAPPIGGHDAAQIRRGRFRAEARLDLHGFTQEEAFRALARFLERARGQGLRAVLVITGKSGVLRNAVPRWLGHAEMRGIVSGLSEAHARDGGGGALYVTLRRERR